MVVWRIVILVIVFGAGALVGWLARERNMGAANPSDHLLNAVTDSRERDSLNEAAPESRDDVILRTIGQLLSKGDYEQAIDFFAQNLSEATDAGVASAGEQFLFQAQRLDMNGAKNHAVLLASKYAATVPQDVDGHVLLSAFHIRSSRFALAAESMARAALASSGSSREQYLDEFNHILRLYVREMLEGSAGQVDVAFLEELAEVIPGHEPLFLEIARSYVAARDFGAASAALQDVNPDGPLALQRQRIAFQIDREIEHEDAFESEVDLTKVGRHFVVNTVIIDDYDEVELRLLLDTGASLTLITPEAADLLNIIPDEVERQATLNTPGGSVVAPIYEVDAIAVGRELIWGVPVAIVPLEINEQVDGLIGMDYLGKFDFKIDQDDHVLRLVRR